LAGASQYLGLLAVNRDEKGSDGSGGGALDDLK